MFGFSPIASAPFGSTAAVTSDRYWVGGSGTWDASTTTNWSLTSGGSGGASVPTQANDVYFDQAGPYTVSVTATRNCKNFTVSGASVTFTGSSGMNISGSFTIASTTVLANTVGYTFTANTVGNTITTNGVSLGSTGTTPVTLNGAGSWTLGSALTLPAAGAVIVFTKGTFDTAGYSLTFGTGLSGFNFSGTAIRSLAFGSSTVTLGSLAIPTTNMTFDAGTSQINFAFATSTLTGNNWTYYNVSFTSSGASSLTVNGSNVFNNLSFTGRTTAGIGTILFGGDQTINGALTISAGTNATMRMALVSGTFATTRTLTCASFSATDADFRDITIAGAAAPASGTRLGDCKGNSGITFDAAKTVYYATTGGGNWGATNAWSFTSLGAADPTAFPLSQDTVIVESSKPNTGSTITVNAAYNIGTIDMSARTSNTMTLATSTNSPTIYGNWINGTGTTLTGTGALTFAGRGSQTITSAGKSFTQIFLISTPSGSVALQDAFSTTSTSTPALQLSFGTFNLNNYNATISAGTVTISGVNTRTLALGSGTLSVGGSSNAFSSNTTTNLTVTGTGTISLTSASAKNFLGGNFSFTNITLNQGGAGALTIQDSNTFGNITNTYASTGATTITFTNNTTTTVGAFTAAGQATRLLTLNNATVGGTAATIALSGGGSVTSPDYLSVRDLSFTPFVTDGTAPYKWNAGANSTNLGNVRGILFAASNVVAYLLASGTSWTVPTDWNNSINTIHLIGGGGGGAGSAASGNNRAGGGGGGAGGYTQLTNQTLTPGATITYAIGSGQSGGTAGNNGTSGGTTSWNSGAATAGGGGGGNVATTPSSSGGTGGTGSTFNGGAGGAGAFGTAASTGYGGGGGGGAAGPSGAGGSGGNGFASTTGISISGGGGGGNGGGTNGGNGSAGTGGTGGNNALGTGGGASTTAGTLGGGGGGAINAVTGANGGSGIDILKTVGGGGGKGGAAQAASTANTALYGAGGGGAGVSTAGTTFAGGAGSNGVIFIVYTLAAVSIDVTVTESASGSDSVFTRTVFRSSINETGSAADLISALTPVLASIIEAASGADTVSRSYTANPVILESGIAADLVSVIASVFNANTSETANLADIVSAMNLLSTSVSETATAADAISSLRTAFGLIAEGVSVSDAFAVAASTFSAPVVETSTATDAVVTRAIFPSSVADTATATEVVVSRYITNPVILESGTGSDLISAAQRFSTQILEAGAGADTVLVAASTFNAPVVEIVVGTDQTVVAPSTFNAPVVETVVIADVLIGAFLWNVIDDSQTPNWQNINTAQGVTWSLIDDSQTPGWTDISTL